MSQVHLLELRNLRPKSFQILFHPVAVRIPLCVARDVVTTLLPALRTQLLQLLARRLCHAVHLDCQVVLLETAIRVGTPTRRVRQRQGWQPLLPLQTELPPHLLRSVELHGSDLGEDAGPPLAKQVFQSLHSALAQPRQETACHRMHQPQMNVRMDATAALRFHGAEIRTHQAERTDRSRGGHTVGNPGAPLARQNADDVLQEQFQHQVRHRRLRHWIRSHSPQHLLRRGHHWRVLLEQTPLRHVGTLVHQRHRQASSVRNVRRGKHQRRAEERAITGTHVAQGCPMCIRADDVCVADQHAAKRALHVGRHCLVGQGLLQAGALAQHGARLNELC